MFTVLSTLLSIPAMFSFVSVWATSSYLNFFVASMQGQPPETQLE